MRQTKSMNRRLPRCMIFTEDDEDVPSLQEEEEQEEDDEEESFDMRNEEVISSYHQFAEAWRLSVILVLASCLVGMSLTTGLYAGSIMITHR